MRFNSFYKILLAAYTASLFSEGILLPIYAVFVQGIGGDILDASGAMAVFLITQGIVTIIAHRVPWIRRRRLHVLIFGWTVWVLGIAMYLLVSNVLTLFLTQILTALGNALADPIFDQELAHHTDKGTEQLEWGLFEGSQDIVQGIAAVIGGGLASIFGFRALIYVMIFAATTSLVFILVYSLKAPLVRKIKHPATS